METPKPNTEQFLREPRENGTGENTGRLKIFFGYAPGVGTTYAMLSQAHG